MTTSGTVLFRLGVEETIREAYERCQVDPALLTRNDWESAMRSLNLLFVSWAVKGVNYWSVDRQPINMVAGTAKYDLADGSLDILSAMINRGGSETVVTRSALVDYDSLPSKATTGLPTNYFLDRQYLGTVTLWPVPDNSTDVFYYWRMAQADDVDALAQDTSAPYRWTEALCAGLAARLARKKNPALVADLTLEASAAFTDAADDEGERASLKIVPAAVVI